MRIVIVCVTSLLALTACAGGGSSGGGGAPPSFSGLNLPLTGEPEAFETAEYQRSGALASIGASTLYASGGTGSGVTVALIDTGVDTSHAELASALHPASRDLLRDIPLADGSGHGTAVAGLLAARRNGWGVHGVAYDATLLAIRIDMQGSCPSACLFRQGDIATATDHAVTHGARVLNYSLGDATELSGELRRSLAAAASADRVLVLAAGNQAQASPLQPALFATTGDARGRAIIVGALGADGAIADYSNRAGSAASVYLVAPGQALTTTRAGGGTTSFSGTSAAAPLVSGAAAALLSAAPHLSGANVVSILLDSARDLGAPGTDPIYGRGMLDLNRALAPIGELRVPEGISTSDASSAYAATSLGLGTAFGGSGSGLGSMMALDAYDRAYAVPLRAHAGPSSGAALADLLARNRAEGLERVTIGGLTLDLLHAGHTTDRTIVRASDMAALAADWRLSDRLSLRAHLGEQPMPAAGPMEHGRRASHGRIAGFADLAAPAGFGLAAGIAGDWRVTLDLAGDPGGVAQEAGGRPGRPSAPPAGRLLATGRMASLGIGRDSASGGWRLGIGALEEDEGPLGSRTSGALRVGGALTHFVELAGTLPLASGLEAFGRAELGRTETAGPGGLIERIGPLWSSAFALGIGGSGLLDASDRLTFTIMQPLRLEDGEATFDLPVARDLAGNIQRERRRADLRPEGRELDLELGYGLDIGAARLRTALMLRLEPDHDARAEPELLLGVSYRLPF